MPTVLKSGSLNLLEPSGPVQACNGIALPLPFIRSYRNQGSVHLNIWRKQNASSAKKWLQQQCARSLCLLSRIQSCEGKSFFSVTARTVNIRLSCTDTQDFLPVSRLKLKRGSLQMPDGAGPSFASPNQSAVLSCSQCDTEENDVSSQPSSRKVQNSTCRRIQSPYQPLRCSHKSKQKLSTLVDMKSSHPSSDCIRNPSQATTCFWLKFRMPG